MPNTSYAQASFLGGEWSQAMQGRFDRPDYRTGMNRALNCLPIASGMAVRRPGTRHAGHTKAGAAGRVLKFDFQQADPYILEFTDYFLRFWSGKNLVTDSSDKTVVSISARGCESASARGCRSANVQWVDLNPDRIMFMAGAVHRDR